MVMSYPEDCHPVSREFGSPPDVDFMDELQEDPSTFAEIAQEIEMGFTRQLEEATNGEAARRALELGCKVCEISEVCSIKPVLEERVMIDQENSRLLEKIQMIDTAQDWLVAARVNRLKDSQVDITQDPEKVDDLLANTTNEINGIFTIKDFPELDRIPNLDPEATVESQTILTESGNKFEVIDISTEIDFRGAYLGSQEYGVLCSKLLERMDCNDKSGEPSVMSPDNIMQKPIKEGCSSDGKSGSLKGLVDLGSSGARLYELRKSNKDRMYFIATKTPDDSKRIIILGSHGGNEKTQINFLNKIKPNKTLT